MEEETKQTKEFRISEFIRCKSDFYYFCKNYMMIEMPGGNIELKLYNKQRELVNLLHTLHYVIVLKTRQIGISTVIQAYICWLHTFYDNVVVGIISKDGSEATSFARIIMGMIDKLPVWLAPKYLKRSEQTYILDNGCAAYATPINPNAPEKTLRGKALTFLIVDEAAFVGHIDDAWTGMMPSISTNQMHAKRNGIPFGTIIISTPNKTVGMGKWFYSRWVFANSGNDIFHPFEIHWKMIPELANDPEWYSTQCRLAGGDIRKIQQELDLKFISTSGSFLDEPTITKLQDIDIRPIEKMKIFGGECWTFERPQRDHFYIMGVDTAPEHGTDKSAITVWDYQSLDQVWEYQTKCQIIDFIRVVKMACSLYPGLCVVEITGGYGNQVLESLERSEYLSMVYKQKRGEAKKVYPGLSTDIHTRPLIIESLYSYITELPNIVKSKRLALELIGLVNKKGGRVEADTGCTDDLCLSAAIAFYVRKWDPPMMLSKTVPGVSEDFMDVVLMNDPSYHPADDRGAEVHIKEMVQEIRDEKPNSAFVDILSLYNKV